MATEYTFNGRLISIPGAYASTKSGVNNQPLDLSYGNVLLIDKDPNNAFGGGAGIAGELSSKEKAIYPFDNIKDFRDFIGGGKLYDNALPLFRPAGLGTNGVSKIFYVRAFTTTASKLALTWSAGAIEVKSKHEGLAGNGVQGNEVKAKQVLNVTAAGAAGNTCIITANGTALGTFTQVAGGTIGTTSAGIAAVINANRFAGLAHGYSAKATGTQVQVYAPDNLGATANGYTFVVANTGTLASAVGAATMAGGVNGTKLTRGFGLTMSAGTVDTAKYVVKFWRGTFAGNDENGVAYSTAEAETEARLIAQSPEFANIQELIDWMGVNIDFNNNFTLASSSVTGAGNLVAADLTATSGNRLFAGGTQTYNTARVDELLDSAKPLDFTFAYTLDSGANATSVDNNKIVASFTTGGAKYEKFLVVAGGNDANTFMSQSVAAANSFNSDRVIVVHGGVEVNVQGGTGRRDKDATYKTAAVLGRMCGLTPQTPITFKLLSYAAEKHALSDSEKEIALKEGVLCTAYDYELQGFGIVAGINTLQANSYVINNDGKSHLISLKRIAAQLNKELEFNAKVELLGNQTSGPNRNTLSAPIATAWARNFLKRKEATDTQDNLIISSQDITATFNQDVLQLNYSFVANTEINKIFMTGTIIDPSLNN